MLVTGWIDSDFTPSTGQPTTTWSPNNPRFDRCRLASAAHSRPLFRRLMFFPSPLSLTSFLPAHSALCTRYSWCALRSPPAASSYRCTLASYQPHFARHLISHCTQYRVHSILITQYHTKQTLHSFLIHSRLSFYHLRVRVNQPLAVILALPDCSSCKHPPKCLSFLFSFLFVYFFLLSTVPTQYTTLHTLHYSSAER